MNHKELDVWKRAVDFVTLVYKVTLSFPESERFGLTNQIRRAAVSIPSNTCLPTGRLPKDRHEIQIRILFAF